MLPASLFVPADLNDAVEEVRRTQGASGVVDLLVTTLTDRRVRSDAEIDQHLDSLKAACRASRRYRETIPVLQRIAVLNPGRKHEVAAEVALVHSHLGEHGKALTLLESAVAQQHRLPAWRRSLAFSLVAELVATLLRQPLLAQECAALGQSTTAPRPARAKQSAPARKRSGLGRSVLATEPALADVGGAQPSGRPRLTLLQGSAA